MSVPVQSSTVWASHNSTHIYNTSTVHKNKIVVALNVAKLLIGAKTPICHKGGRVFVSWKIIIDGKYSLKFLTAEEISILKSIIPKETKLSNKKLKVFTKTIKLNQYNLNCLKTCA